MIDQLVDGHGREISDLRVSVTDICNFRCQYCMPAEGLDWLPRNDVLSFEEIARLVEIFTTIGIRDVRLTGGEPLARRDFPLLAAMLGAIEAIEDLSITTNGYLLRRHAAALVAAGIDRFNVSLDALSPERFHKVTRRNALAKVLDGISALAATPGVGPIKINAVSLRDVTEHELPAFAEFARSHPFQVRFIEWMPLGAEASWDLSTVLTGDEVRRRIDAIHPLIAVPRAPHATARVYRFADGIGEVAFINPVSEPFCADCNRVRLTAEGRLRTCLFSINETDLRTPLRDGASDSEIEQIIRDAVWRKELKHRVGERGFRRPARTMSQIGG